MDCMQNLHYSTINHLFTNNSTEQIWNSLNYIVQLYWMGSHRNVTKRLLAASAAAIHKTIISGPIQPSIWDWSKCRTRIVTYLQTCTAKMHTGSIFSSCWWILLISYFCFLLKFVPACVQVLPNSSFGCSRNLSPPPWSGRLWPRWWFLCCINSWFERDFNFRGSFPWFKDLSLRPTF